MDHHNNSFRKNKARRNEQGSQQGGKRYGQQKYEERRGQNFNNFKQNTNLIEEKEMPGNEDKLSNVSTANSDKKNQVPEDESQPRKLDYEFRLVSEQGESCLRIENVIILNIL